MRMISQKYENLVYVQQQNSFSFCEQFFSYIISFPADKWRFYFQCKIFMLLTMTKYLENLIVLCFSFLYSF